MYNFSVLTLKFNRGNYKNIRQIEKFISLKKDAHNMHPSHYCYQIWGN